MPISNATALEQTPSSPNAAGLSPFAGAEGAHRRRGFTLVEILTVIAVIGVLVSITIGITRGVQQRSQVGRAKSDLSALAAALERYKLQYGDYPMTPDGLTAGGESLDGGAILFNALCGNLGPTGTELPQKGRSFIEISRFRLDLNAPEDLPDPDSTTLKLNWFADPWGKWYYYEYRKSPSDTVWVSPSYLLYSHGPDGECDIGQAESTGMLKDLPTDAETQAENEDNLYAGIDT